MSTLSPHARFAYEEDTTPTVTFTAIPDEMPTMVIPAAVLRMMHRAPHKPEPRVVAILPAHNEGELIAATIEALQGQTRPPDEILVMTDNCTDTEAAWLAFRAQAQEAEQAGDDKAMAQFEKDHGATPPPAEGLTAATAARYGVTVASTVGNKDMKAGNLNRALALTLPRLADTDVVMNFDADSVPERHFVANALKWLKRGYGAVGATFHGRPGGGLLGLVQRSEFARFARHQHRKLHCDVLSGTGAAFPVWALRKIAATRPDGSVYDIAHITEDFELTLALKHAGISAVAPADCQVVTDIMTSYKDWWTQRLRWQLGTLFALRQYGWTQSTRELIIRQVLIYVVMVATPLTVIYLAWSFAIYGWSGINPVNAPLYAAGIGIVVLEQAWQARRAGARSISATLALWPDFFYSVIRQVVYVRAAWKLLRGHSLGWGAGTGIAASGEVSEDPDSEKVLSINTIHVPWGYVILNHVIQVFTVSMAVLALVRLRPARRRARHDSAIAAAQHHGDRDGLPGPAGHRLDRGPRHPAAVRAQRGRRRRARLRRRHQLDGVPVGDPGLGPEQRLARPGQRQPGRQRLPEPADHQ